MRDVRRWRHDSQLRPRGSRQAAADAIAGREDLVTKFDLERDVNRVQTEMGRIEADLKATMADMKLLKLGYGPAIIGLLIELVFFPQWLVRSTPRPVATANPGVPFRVVPARLCNRPNQATEGATIPCPMWRMARSNVPVA